MRISTDVKFSDNLNCIIFACFDTVIIGEIKFC